MITCGEFGGVTAEGKPCGQAAGSGTGRQGYGPCRDHFNVPIDRYPDPKKHAFLVAYCSTGNISRAAAAAKIDRSLHYKWLELDPNYVLAFHQAKEVAADELEAEALRRAQYGVEEPVFYQGDLVARVRKYSDLLLIFLLKGLRPEKYRERHEVAHSGEVKGGVLLVPTPVSAEEWSAIAARQQAHLIASASELAEQHTGVKLGPRGNGQG